MKKTWQFIMVIIAVLCLMPLSPVGATNIGQTYITGHVTQNGQPVSGVVVLAGCGRYFADTDRTDDSGTYLVSFPAWQCGWGSEIQLLVNNDTAYGNAAGLTEKINSKYNLLVLDVEMY